MIDDPQIFFNIVFGTAGALAGFVLNSLWTAMKDLQSADLNLAEKVSRIEVLVAGSYVTRDELKDMMKTIFIKLDRIEEKLDNKADK